ncbi:MAG TPA: arginine repressor [Actinomycetota bacterium]|nr:arginine repressor [Actinomycetota bacterium]
MAARLSRADKQARQRRIVEILRRSDVESQGELARLLARGGDKVTQATLSRDLEELGAVKVRAGDGRVVYRVPDEPPQPTDWLERMLREFLLEMDTSGNLCVLKTPPGGANAVARALDNASVPDVLATIAGDDTILIVAKEGSTGKAVARRLRSLAGQAGGAKGRDRSS